MSQKSEHENLRKDLINDFGGKKLTVHKIGYPEVLDISRQI